MIKIGKIDKVLQISEQLIISILIDADVVPKIMIGGKIKLSKSGFTNVKGVSMASNNKKIDLIIENVGKEVIPKEGETVFANV